MADEMDVVNMSDEDFSNLPLPEDQDLKQREEDAESDASVKEEEELARTDDDDEEAEDDKSVDTNLDDDEENEDDEEDDSEEEDDEDDEEDSDDVGEDEDSEEEDEEDDKEDKDDSEDAEDDKKDDPADSDSDNWKELTKPFRANNTEMKVDNVVDARRLMSMGANYHKKMVDMKEDRKFIETLRDNELLDQGKLNLLIDVSKGKKAAITQLLKDNNINPLDIDVDGTSDYEPNSYSTGDEKLNLRDVLSGLRDTATYEQTMTIVTEKWDEASQNAIMGKPDVLNTINDHVANGVYDIISAKVAELQPLGKLDGLNSVEAYIAAGNILEADGKLGDNKQTTDKTTPDKKESKPAPKKVVKPADAKKRKRAAAPKQRAPRKAVLDFDNMSDDEFSKQFDKLNH